MSAFNKAKQCEMESIHCDQFCRFVDQLHVLSQRPTNHHQWKITTVWNGEAASGRGEPILASVTPKYNIHRRIGSVPSASLLQMATSQKRNSEQFPIMPPTQGAGSADKWTQPFTEADMRPRAGQVTRVICQNKPVMKVSRTQLVNTRAIWANKDICSPWDSEGRHA